MSCHRIGLGMNSVVEKSVNDFNSDWYDVYGEGKVICDL